MHLCCVCVMNVKECNSALDTECVLIMNFKECNFVLDTESVHIMNFKECNFVLDTECLCLHLLPFTHGLTCEGSHFCVITSNGINDYYVNDDYDI